MIVMEEVRLYKDSNRALRGPGSGCEAHQAAYLRPRFNVSSLTDSGIAAIHSISIVLSICPY
jgi:hypothetical protein